MSGPTFADVALTYHRRGWPVLPLEPGKKFPPPRGYTGGAGVDADDAQIVRWAHDPLYAGTSQVALRMPPGVIGIDVDAHSGKRGGETLAEASRRWGALQPTWRSSARADDPVSGIRFYRVPDDVRLVSEIEVTVGGHTLSDIEIIQRHHRYAVVCPSVHPNTGEPYCWYPPRGAPGWAMMPTVSDYGGVELPWLPPRWVEALRRAALTPVAAVVDDQVEAMISAMPGGKPCAAVEDVLRSACEDVRHRAGSRHESAAQAVMALVRFGERGHPGAAAALGLLRTVFVDAVTADASRTTEDASAEFARLRGGAVSKVGGAPTEAWQRGCRCTSPGGPVSRERVNRLIDRIRQADGEQRPGLIRWGQTQVRSWVRRGLIDAEFGRRFTDGLEVLR